MIRRANWPVTLLGLLAVLAICVAALSSAYILREESKQEWKDQLSSLSLVLAEHAGQTLFSAHTVLDVLVEHVRQKNFRDAQAFRSALASEAYFRMLRDKTEGMPIIDVATFVAANGDVINFTRSYPAPAINLSDRDYFKEHLHNSKAGTYLSIPVRNKGNGKWMFYLSRRVDSAKGELLGLVLVGVSAEVFSRFYESIGSHLGAGTSISMYRDDFTLMTRWPFVDDMVGKRNLTGVTHASMANQETDNGVLESDKPRMMERNPNSSSIRLSAPRRVQGYPLIMTPTVTQDVYLRNWRKAMLWLALVVVVSLIMLTIALAQLFKIFRLRMANLQTLSRLKADAELAAENLRLAKNAAEAANQAKRQFLTHMSHELRTPLNGVLGMTRLCLDTPLSEQQRGYLNMVHSSAETLLLLVNDILDFSNIETGKLQLEELEFDLKDLLSHVAATLSRQAAEKKLSGLCRLAPELPARVLGDPVRLQQVLGHLIGNAIKFTASGSVSLSVGLSPDTGTVAQAVRLRFEVSDTGIGIAPDRLDRIFMAFTQGDASSTRDFGGSGLGLSIAHELVTLMGGALKVQSQVGVGSTFEFELQLATPAVEARAGRPAPLQTLASLPLPGLEGTDAPATTPPRPEAAQAPSRVLPTTPRLKLLLAENPREPAHSVGPTLQSFGHAVQHAANGIDAVRLAAQEDFDLILLDVQMPEMGGLEAAELIRGHEREAFRARTPLVAMLATPPGGVYERLRDPRVDAWLYKPAQAAALAQVTQQALGAAAIAPLP